MTVQVGHLSLVGGPERPVPPAAPAPPGIEPASGPVTSDVVPATAPPEVAEQVHAAFERAGELYAANRELHFAKDPESGRIVVEVRDLEGNVVRTIPPSEALEVMTGGLDL